jgi:hypothetical protein
MAWAVSTEVAVLWAVIAFSGGYGARHAVGDDEPAAAAAPPSAPLVSAGQSECFDGCVGVPLSDYMQSDLPLSDVLALGRTLCFASGANMTQVSNSTAEAAGRVILHVDDPWVGEATIYGGHLLCFANETFDNCGSRTDLENDNSNVVNGTQMRVNILGSCGCTFHCMSCGCCDIGYNQVCSTENTCHKSLFCRDENYQDDHRRCVCMETWNPLDSTCK